MQPITQAQVKQWLPRRPQTAHKGTFGRVLVVAGSRTMCGAGFLCAKSALSAGAGLVYWALPQEMQAAFAAALPEAITFPLPQTASGEIDACAWEQITAICQTYKPSVCVVGPGMGSSPLLPRLIQQISLPMVVDADALNALAHMPDGLRIGSNRPAIFTPHAAEMARLLHTTLATDEATRQAQVQQLAQRTGGVCLLKGFHTYVAWGTHCFENTTGGPALAKAGSGDVLAGVLAGLWAQWGTAEGFTLDSAGKAAVCGVYLHGLAGDLAARNSSEVSVLAQDTLAYVARAFRTVQEGA